MTGNVLHSRIVSVPLPKPTLSENASVGRRWTFRRNMVIFIASRSGVSQRLLADVFDLPHSRIAAIIKDFRLKYAD
jgi:hypothetical protein